MYPRPRDLESTLPELETKGLSRVYWIYLAAMALNAAGYADYPLIAYHFQIASTVSPAWIPVFYAIAMGVDAVAALVIGRWFDVRGIPVLVVSFVIAAFFVRLVFLGGFYAALVGAALWGVGMEAQESIMRAAIAGMVSADKPGTAYGVFNTEYGIFWFLDSALMGFLYDFSVASLIAFSLITQLSSVPLLLLIGRKRGSN